VKLMAVISTTLLGACMSTTAIGAGASWKEEVQLHDGQKIIAERYVQRGGRSEVGQKGAYVAQSLSFTLPNRSHSIEWKDNFSEDIGSVSFLPMLLDVVGGTPYLVARPMGCLSYNKWGRPNPPYVVFKHEANAWKRIALEELPLQIKTPNLISSAPDLEVEKLGQRVVSAQVIQQLVANYKNPESKTILREPLPKARIEAMCEEMVRYKCGWGAPGEFNKKYFESICK